MPQARATARPACVHQRAAEATANNASTEPATQGKLHFQSSALLILLRLVLLLHLVLRLVLLSVSMLLLLLSLLKLELLQ